MRKFYLILLLLLMLPTPRQALSDSLPKAAAAPQEEDPLFGISLLKDINPGTEDSYPRFLASITPSSDAPYVLFRASTPDHGSELWRTSGTAENTTLIKDIRPGFVGAYPSHFTSLGDWTFFSADDGTHGKEVWKTDGTTANTSLVADINPAGDSAPYRFIVVNDKMLFVAEDGTHGRELWVSDGTPAGTEMVKDISPGSTSGVPYSETSYAVLDGFLYFAADDGTHGVELWRSDGTLSKTTMVMDINPGGSSTPLYLTAFGDQLLFSADDGTHGTEPWVSDGTPEGTQILDDLNTNGDSHPAKFYPLGETLYFATGPNTTQSYTLWRTDGTATSTLFLKDVQMRNHIDAACFGDLNGVLYFQGDGDDGTGQELWRSDGTPGGTYQLMDIFPGETSASPCFFTRAGSQLLFAASGSTASGRELWSTNGTTTEMVTEIHPTRDALPIYTLEYAALNEQLIFAADDGPHGTEPWISDGTPGGTHLILDIHDQNADGVPDSIWGDGPQLTAAGDSLFFAGIDAYEGLSLWKTHGAASTTHLAASAEPMNLTATGNRVFFNTPDSKLWKSDDAPPGESQSTPVYYFPNNCIDGPCLGHLAGSGGRLYFAAHVGSSYGTELWTSNGSTQSTERLTDINPGSGNAVPYSLTDVDEKLFFTADDGSHGRELWVLDDITRTVSMLMDINLSGSSYPSSLTAFGEQLFFYANDGIHGKELWLSDGTSSGTSLIKDINPLTTCNTYGSAPGSGSSPCSSYPFPMVMLGDAMLFKADDGVHGEELWVTDGTPSGTQLVKDINTLTNCGIYGTPTDPPESYPCDSQIMGSAEMKGAVYFFADDGLNGMELWRTDGTPGGTERITSDLSSLWISMNVKIATLDQTLFFSAMDSAHGAELWQSDGTDAGTKLTMDINLLNTCSTDGLSPGGGMPCGSWPADLTVHHETLYFTADDGIHGREVWVLRLLTKDYFLPLAVK